MASTKEFVLYLIEQMESAGQVTYKSMFGEYGLYLDTKLFGVVCDNMLYIKPTEAGRVFIGNVTEAPPYPGAKPSFLIEEKIEDREWISNLVRLTTHELPEPKPKKPNKKKLWN